MTACSMTTIPSRPSSFALFIHESTVATNVSSLSEAGREATADIRDDLRAAERGTMNSPSSSAAAFTTASTASALSSSFLSEVSTTACSVADRLSARATSDSFSGPEDMSARSAMRRKNCGLPQTFSEAETAVGNSRRDAAASLSIMESIMLISSGRGALLPAKPEDEERRAREGGCGRREKGRGRNAWARKTRRTMTHVSRRIILL
mmetsp:Transcript_26508/g.55266  ORF Transcript_26508/g.55266 Transcript_26508/m.55266 type:complete len:207 (+) Transcript_26508:418-1038(+)